MSQYTNRHGLPDWWCETVAKSMGEYSKGNADYSVSDLYEHPHKRLLQMEHGHKYPRDISDLTHSLIGNAVHAMVQTKGETERTIHENRLFLEVEVEGVKRVVSGATDVLELDQDTQVVFDSTLWDIKTCRTFKWKMVNEGKSDEWEVKMNLYAEMWRRCEGVEVSRIKVLAVLKDWSLTEQERESGYPPSSATVIDLPVWPRDRVDEYLRERITAHDRAARKAAEQGLRSLETCDEQARWTRPGDHAVVKVGKDEDISLLHTKRATRRFQVDAENTDEAADWPVPFKAMLSAAAYADAMNEKEEEKKKPSGRYLTVFRPGKDIRCRPEYCSVCPECPYWQATGVTG